MEDKNKEVENKVMSDLLLNLKDSLKSASLYIEKIEKELEKQNSKPLNVSKDQISSDKTTDKKSSMIRRVDDEDERAEQPPSYTIKVVGLGTTKVDF